MGSRGRSAVRFRGAASLAIAPSNPNALPGDSSGGRDAIIFATARLIVLALLVHGPLLPVGVGWARPPPQSRRARSRCSRRTIGEKGLMSLGELAADEQVEAPVRESVLEELRESLAVVPSARGVATLLLGAHLMPLCIGSRQVSTSPDSELTRVKHTPLVPRSQRS